MTDKKNIYITGFMGSGKTETAKALGKLTGLPVIDTDQTISDMESMDIPSIFRMYGETVFREFEADIIDDLSHFKGPHKIKGPFIVSCGGGVPMRVKNRELMKESGTVILLEASVETITKRLEDDHTRPLIEGKDRKKEIERLLKERNSSYLKAADIIISTDNLTPDEIAKKICEDLNLL